MKYALITTFDVEQPYSFREVLPEKIQGDFPGVFWVEITDDLEITPKTHRYTDNGFEKLPERPPRVIPTPVNPAECTNTEQPTVL
jgi:hypothetical protein